MVWYSHVELLNLCLALKRELGWFKLLEFLDLLYLHVFNDPYRVFCLVFLFLSVIIPLSLSIFIKRNWSHKLYCMILVYLKCAGIEIVHLFGDFAELADEFVTVDVWSLSTSAAEVGLYATVIKHTLKFFFAHMLVTLTKSRAIVSHFLRLFLSVILN